MIFVLEAELIAVSGQVNSGFVQKSFFGSRHKPDCRPELRHGHRFAACKKIRSLQCEPVGSLGIYDPTAPFYKKIVFLLTLPPVNRVALPLLNYAFVVGKSGCHD